MKKMMILTLSGLMLLGCAKSAQLANKTAFVLGEDESQVSISNINRGIYETTWRATTPSGSYNCSAVGGNAMTFGVATTPSCIKLGEKMKAGQKRGVCNAMLKAAGRCQ